ncbi:hypothetical protein KY321_02430 [Candidatus Woesearchaeota archaeon]|nr:hypothetical protein [Candidatus Woesearchaeota archaeon]
MVTKKQKERMKEFIAEQFHASSRYHVDMVGKNGIVLLKQEDLFEDPKSIYLMTIADKNLGEKERLLNQVLGKYDLVSHVFYGDHKNFLVRLAESAQRRKNKSLKLHRAHLNELYHLRDLEKLVLGKQRINSLTYYCPELNGSREVLKEYSVSDVTLNYSHIPPNEQPYDFVENRVSDDYKRLNEKKTSSELGFRGLAHNRIVSLQPKRK